MECHVDDSKNERLNDLINRYGQKEGLERYLEEISQDNLKQLLDDKEDPISIKNSERFVKNLETQIELKYKTVNTLIIQARQESKKEGNEEKVASIRGEIQKAYLEINTLRKSIDAFKEDINLHKLVELAFSQLEWVESLVNKGNVLPSEMIEAFRIVETWENIDDLLFGGDLNNPNVKISPLIQKELNAIKTVVNDMDLTHKLFNLNASFLAKVSQYDSISEFLGEIYDLKDVSTVNAYANFLGDMNVKFLSKIDRLNREATARIQGEMSSWLNRLKPIEDLEKGGKLKDLWQRDSKGDLTGGLVTKYTQLWYNDLKRYFGIFSRTMISSKATVSGKIGSLRKLSEWLNGNTVYVDMRFFEKKDFINEKGQNFNQHYKEIVSKVGKEEADSMVKKAKESFETYKIDLDNYTTYMESQLLEIADEDKRKKALQEARNKWIRVNSPLVWLRQINQNFYTSNSITITQTSANKYVYYTPIPKSKEGKSTGYYDSTYEKIMADPQLQEAYNLIKDFMAEMMSYLPNYINLQSNFLPKVHKHLIQDLTINGLWTALIKAPENFIQGITEKIDNLNIEGEESTYEKMTKKIPVRYVSGHFTEEMSMEFSKILPLFAKEALNYKWKSQIQDTIELSYKFLNDISDSTVRKDISSDDLKNIRNSLEWFMDTQLYQTKRLDEGKSKIKTFIGTDRLTFEVRDATPEIKKEILKVFKELKENNTNDDAVKILKDKFPDNVVIVDSKEKYKQLKQEMFRIEDRFEKGEINEKTRDELIEALEKEAEVLGKNLVWSKVLDKALTHNQAMMFWFNPFTAFNNWAFGIVSNIIWAEGGVDFTRKDVYKAVLLMWKSIFNLKDGKMDKIAQLIRKFDVMEERLEYQPQTENVTLKKIKDFPYLPLRWGDYFIKGITLTSAMLHKKIKVNIKGKEQEISLFDAFDEHGNWRVEELGENKDWAGNFSEPEDNKEFIKFKTFIKSLTIKLHGNYDSLTMPMFKKYVVLRMLGQVRASWMIEGIKSRFEKKRFDEFLGREIEGRYITLAKLGITKSLKTLSRIALEHIGISQNWENLPARERAIILENMRKNFAEIRLYAMMLATYLLLKASVDDDDEEDRQISVTLNILNRIMQDTTFYLSPKTFVEIIKDPLPLLGLFLRASRGIDSAIELIMKDDITDKEVEQDWKNIASNFYFINQYVKYENMATKIY